MSTKHFTNSPFQRERAKLGQTQKPGLVFLSGKDLILNTRAFLNAVFSWWFLCSLVCLYPELWEGVAPARGVWAFPSRAVGCSHPCAISCPSFHASPWSQFMGWWERKLSCDGSILRAGGENSGGFHPYNPHLPPRATGCLQMLLTGGYQPAPCWKLINQLHSVSGASGYSCISSPCSKVICWNPSAAGLGQALSMACNSPSLRQPATLLDSSFTEPTRLGA